MSENAKRLYDYIQTNDPNPKQFGSLDSFSEKLTDPASAEKLRLYLDNEQFGDSTTFYNKINEGLIQEEQKTIKSDITYQDEQLNALNQKIVSNIDNRLQFKVREPEPEEPIIEEPPPEPSFTEKIQPYVKNWNKSVDDFNSAFGASIDNLVTGRTTTAEAWEPVTEYFNRFRDEDEQVTDDEIVANIAEGATKLAGLPVQIVRDITEHPWDFVKFLMIESPKMIGELIQAGGLDPVLQTRIAFGDKEAIAYKKKMINKINQYPVEYFMQPFIFKATAKQATQLPKKIKPVAEYYKTKAKAPLYKPVQIKLTKPEIEAIRQEFGGVIGRKKIPEVESYVRELTQKPEGVQTLRKIVTEGKMEVPLKDAILKKLRIKPKEVFDIPKAKPKQIPAKTGIEPTIPIKPVEIVKEPKIEPVEVPKKPVTQVEVTPVSPEITPEMVKKEMTNVKIKNEDFVVEEADGDPIKTIKLGSGTEYRIRRLKDDDTGENLGWSLYKKNQKSGEWEWGEGGMDYQYAIGYIKRIEARKTLEQRKITPEVKKESKKTTKVYHGGDLKKLSSSQDLYVSENKKEAINYIEQGSERGQGDSLYEIEIPENKIASEEEADNILKDLGISDEYMLHEKIGAEFGESYIGLKNVKKLYKKLKEKGYGAIRFLDSGLENRTSENIVIINQDIIKQKFKESKIVNEIDAELLLEQGYKPLINGKIIEKTNNLESLFDNSETIEMVKPIDDVPVKTTAEAVKAEKEIALNKQYTNLLDAQAAAQSNLMLEGLAGMQRQQLEQSFEQSTKRLEDLELEAKTKGITLEKKITETEAIKEVVDLFKELDPEVDYQTKLDELRTLQDNIDDPLSPETPENALAQIEAAGQEFVGVEPADIKIAGENYQELRDGALVDVVKLHQGADIGTVVEERAELWYRQQEELNPKFDKTITEERRKYHERTGEKDDPSQSNGEWFSDRAKDNAIGAKPKGKVGDVLTRIFRKFREYADALRKSASRFAKYVKQGKVSKDLKDFLDRSVSEKLRTPEQIHAELMKDVKGEPSPTKINYSLKKTKEITLPSVSKNRGVTFITGDPVNINLKGEYEDFGIRYPRTYKGWALNSSAAVTKLLNDTKAGYNVVGITSLVDAKGSMVKNRAYLNALYRELENKVGKRKAKSLLDKTGDIFQAVKEAKISAVQVAKETAVPDFAQIARKVVAVATIKDFRTGGERKNVHPEYDIEVNFDKYLELPEPIDLDTFVEALPKTDSRVANPFYAAKQYWLTVLNQESPQVKMLSDFAATGDASIFGVKPEAYQFASPQIKEIGLPEAIKGIKSKKLQQYHRSVAEVEVELGIKSMTTASLGEWATGAEPSVMTTITEPVSYEKREYLAAIKGLMGNQEAILDFEVNPEGVDNLYKINLDVSLKDLPRIVESLTKRGIEYKTMPVTGNKVDLVVVDEGGQLVNYVNLVRRRFNAKTRLQRGDARFVGDFGNRARADKRYVEIIRKYEGDTGQYSKVLRDRLPVHRPRFNRSVLPKKTRPTYQLKKITPDERKLREEKKRKLAELIDEGVEAVRQQIPMLIQNLRAELSLTSLETNSFLNDIKQITTLEQRELIPFLLEKATTIPKKLKRPDLEKLMQDKKLVENLQPVVESFRKRFKELWDRIAKENPELSRKEIMDYVTHIWDIATNKKADVARWFSTYNKFTEKRYIETLVEGIDKYDLKPKYTDINDIYNIYASIANKSLANKKFVANLRKLNVGGKPLITMPQHAPDGWAEIHHPAMKNPFTQTYYKVHPELVSPIKVVLGERFEGGRVLSAYEALNGGLKQMQLALSLFHHLALTETAMPIVSYRDVPKMLGVLLKTPWKGFIKMESDVWKNLPLARDFLVHRGQLGVSVDIPVHKITSAIKSLEVKMKGVPVAEQATKLASGFYERWNFALWDYLHDNYKLFAYESLVSRYKGDNIDTFKYEAAQLVNDTFGGQNWDVLMVNPKTVQVMTWFLLSPDWTVSTMRQALAPTGLGSAMKTKEGKKMRAKMGRRFWLKAMLYYGALINTLNYLNRKKDMEDNPDYYPDKEDYGFWDYTMFGNTIGSQTKLFMGRYTDGTEEYLRWGKQFREFIELFYDDTGFNFPQAAVKKVGGKTAPIVQTTTQIFTGKSPSGFENYDLKDKKGTEWLYGLTKTLMRTPLPFSTQAALDKTKEWKFSNIAVPSSRGMTARKAGDLMEIALAANDEEMMRQIFIGCSRNKINALDIFEGTMNRMKSDYRIEETRLLREADELMAKANDPKTPSHDKTYLMKRAAQKIEDAKLAQKPQALFKIAMGKLKQGKIQFPEVFGEYEKK
jgi:hypothetical protein